MLKVYERSKNSDFRKRWGFWTFHSGLWCHETLNVPIHPPTPPQIILFTCTVQITVQKVHILPEWSTCSIYSKMLWTFFWIFQMHVMLLKPAHIKFACVCLWYAHFFFHTFYWSCSYSHVMPKVLSSLTVHWEEFCVLKIRYCNIEWLRFLHINRLHTKAELVQIIQHIKDKLDYYFIGTFGCGW